MVSGTEDDTDRSRARLSRDRVLRTAVQVADEGGLAAVTMRGLADELGVEAMSLYHHVTNKQAVLDGALEVVVAEILAAVDAAMTGAPAPDEDWRASLRARILAARDVLLAHPWAPRVLETQRSLSGPVMRYFDGLLGVLMAGGFSPDLAHHTMHALGSRAMGFTQELFEPDDPAASDDDVEAMFEQMADQLPHMVAMMAAVAHDDPDSTIGWCDDQAEFEFGLDLILDGLERHRTLA